jgi:hypothetical protein
VAGRANRAIAFALCVAAAVSLSACLRAPSPRHWTDDVRLHDGRTLQVKRTVYFHYGGGELSEALRPHPDQYAFEATDPDTGNRITWKGDRDFLAVLLDFVSGTPYLVIFSMTGNLKQYGCPEIPYVFLRFDRVADEWRQVAAADFPHDLQVPNLSADYYSSGSMTPDHRSADDIQRAAAGLAAGSSGSYAPIIPRSFAAWNAKHRNSWRNRHESDGCRYTVPSTDDPKHIQSPGQPSQTVTLEVLDTKVYDPPKVIEGNNQIQAQNWIALTVNVDQAKNCHSRLRQIGDDTDRPELIGWWMFSEDPTGRNKARMPSWMYCDADAFWFSDYGIERGNVVLTKFTRTGGPVYRISFHTPAVLGGLPGGIIQKTFRREGGYLYFEWWNADQSGWSHMISAIRTVRMREPPPTAAGTADRPSGEATPLSP